MQGGLKAKRLSQLIASLGGSSARKGLGESHRLVRLRDLMLGGNKGVAVALKVTSSSTVVVTATIARAYDIEVALVWRKPFLDLVGLLDQGITKYCWNAVRVR